MTLQHVQLHNHSSKSALDGVSTPRELVEAAAKYGAPAIAVTDHGNIMAEYELYAACQEFGVKPIMGIETYMLNAPQYVGVAKKTNLDKDALLSDPLYGLFSNLYASGEGYKRLHHHLLLLALNDTGRKNIRILTSFSHQYGYYYKPAVTHAALQQYSDGVLATTGCLAAEVPALLARGYDAEAEQILLWYRELFNGRFFVELQRHDIPELEIANQKLVVLAEKYSIPVILTCDAHYVSPEQAKIQEVLVQIATNVGSSKGAKLATDKEESGGAKTEENNGKQFKFHGTGYHYLSPQEVRDLFSDLPKVDEYMANTLAIADMVNYSKLIPKNFEMPRIHPELTAEQKYDLLREKVYAGAKELYGDPLGEEVIERIEYELGVIGKMGFIDYFHILDDIVSYMRSEGILYNIRGSGGGSVIMYCLKITFTDPLKHHLLFERFLNEERVTLPDVDIDIEDVRREQMVAYLRDKYGKSNVAKILTFGTLKPKAAIRDAARLYGVKPENINKLSKSVPDDYTTYEEMEADGNFMGFVQQYVDWEKIMEATKQLVGRIRNVGTHPAGVLITPQEITEYTAFHRPTDAAKDVDLDDIQPVHLDMGNAETAHLVKFDLLGLRTLTEIHETLKLIEQRHGKVIRYEDIPVEYNDSFKLMWRGDTIGIFQLASDGMTDLLMRLKPTSLAQVIAIISLYRPGPMQFIDDYIAKAQGQKEPEYASPKLEPILAETYGIIVYQEQIIQILKLVGFSGGEADNIRRAISKKKASVMEKYRGKFIEMAMANLGISKDEAEKIWADIEKFAGYGFNKSHSASYGQVGAITAWLKYNYRLEYTTACMNCEYAHLDKLMAFVGDARMAGIKILPVDINASDKLFKIEGGQIRYGLMAVKNVKADTIDLIVAEREANGPYKGFDDLLERVKVDTATMSALVLAGAFDATINPDPNKVFCQRTSNRYVVAVNLPPKYQKSLGKMSGWEDLKFPKSPIEWLRCEYDILGGTYLSAHPLKVLVEANSNFRGGFTFPDYLMKKVAVGGKVKTVGIITDLYINTERMWIFASLLGFNQPAVRIAIFPGKNYQKIASIIKENHIFTLDVLRGQRGFTVENIKQVGYLYDPTTYLPG